MKKYRSIRQVETGHGVEQFIGESIEQKIRRTTQGGEPIEAISPMIYTERKEGVRAETNIRTDKWDIAQSAMNQIADGHRKQREERIKAQDKPAEQTN